MAKAPILKDGLIRSGDLLSELNNDVISAYETLETNRSSQYLRRCTVRAIFVYIEAVIEIIKIELRSNIRTDFITPTLSDRESRLLGSLSIFRTDDHRIGLLDNLKGTFKLASRLWELQDFELDTGGLDYEDFRRAKVARDRLTHPKTYCDIQITDEDMSSCSIAGMWVRDSFERLFSERSKQLLDRIAIEINK